MIHSRLSGLAMAAMVFYAPASLLQTSVLCQGFVPPNDLSIPVTRFQVGGISEAEFNSVLDKVEAYYAPIIAAKGGAFQVNRRWTDSTVNADARRRRNVWEINMYGGLARHPQMTADGFTLVACHETGHHIGGAPKSQGFFGRDWASNEGAADYFATLNCLRNVFTDADNARFVRENTIDPIAKQKCEELYTTQEEENLCMREAMASMTGGKLFQALHQETTEPRFDTPDPNQVSQTDDDHPATQCRMDTYYQGSLCVHDKTVDQSDSDPNVGTCSEANGQKDGLRPRCWFKP